MTRLFVGIYLGVLAALFAAWSIYGYVLKDRSDADFARVVVLAHRGGARLVASELQGLSQPERQQKLAKFRGKFAYPLEILPIDSLFDGVQDTLRSGEDVAYVRRDNQHSVVAKLSEDEVVQLGPFPDLDLIEIEQAIGGWMRLTAAKLNDVATDDRAAVLSNLRTQYDFPVEVITSKDLPDWPAGRMLQGTDVVFYPVGETSDQKWYASIPLEQSDQLLRCGPFPSFQQLDQKAATTTVALVLLPVALVIALLLRPIVWQLRHIEQTAKSIANGDLSARANEKSLSSTKPLAQAFNNMAGRTETLIRTQRELLQAVSHELRTPLARMRFAIDLIESASDDAERKQRLDALDMATEELDELVGELLSYVRMESAEPQLERETIFLREMFDSLTNKYAALHPKVDFSVSDQIADEQQVVADRIGFQRAIGNLLSNAGRYASSQVSVSVNATDETLIIDIDDDGIGIPETDRERIFEPFVRLEDDSKGRGAGLGLALVKRIVTQHAGHVNVSTSPLGGCRIRTEWPCSA